MKEKKQLLTDEEYKQVILMAVTGKPQTKEQIAAVIEEAETMRCNALVLESVLTGLLCMYDENGTIMFRQPNEKS
jgi:hypothetical protein